LESFNRQDYTSKMRAKRVYVWIGVVATVGVLVALCVLGPQMRPLHPASQWHFWNVLSGVDFAPPSATKSASDLDRETLLWLAQRPVVAALDQDRFIFSSQYSFATFGDNPYDVISAKEVELDFPAVQKELSRRASLENADDYQAAGYAKWKAIEPASNNGGIVGLFDCIDKARADWIEGAHAAMLPVSAAFDFKKTVGRSLRKGAALLAQLSLRGNLFQRSDLVHIVALHF
jgi:hypothetical protein